jgi:electron transfer flavoprotein beta subunit
VKILVPVKQVARLREGFDGVLPFAPDALEWCPDERDMHSLETALALNEGAAPDGETIVVTVGSERAEPALRAGLAMGADRAIRMWDESLASPREDVDPLTVARLLAGVAAIEAPELILCGTQSSDMANAATGIALAGLLDVAHVAVVSAVERDGEQLLVQRELAGGAVELLHEQLLVQRELAGGAVELLRVATPALLSVQTASRAPRRPNLRAIKQARSAPLTVLGFDDLGLDADAVAAARGSRTVRLLARPRRTATMLEGSPAQIAAQITEIVGKALSS